MTSDVTRDLFEQLMHDEEEHINFLETQIDLVARIGLELYAQRHIGQLDEDAVFYLRSRGLDSAAARGILTFAFANDLVSQIKLESIRLQTERLVRRWLLNSDCSREVV